MKHQYNFILPLFALLLTSSVTFLEQKAWACSYFDDEQLAQQKTACEKDSSKEWSCDRNACISTREAKQDREEYYECQKQENPAAIKACVDAYAARKGAKFPEGKKPPYMLGAGVGAAFATLILLNGAAKGAGASDCISKTILMGTGVAGILGEVYFKLFAEKELKKLQKNYQDDLDFKDPFDAQVKAFQYLKEEQELIAKLAGQRKTAYTLLTVGYGAALAMVAYDMIAKPPAGGKCSGKSEEGEKNKKGGESEQDKNGKPNDASADGGNKPTDTQEVTKVETKLASDAKQKPGADKGFGAMLTSAPGIAIMAGIGTGLSIYLAKAASDQKKMATENAEKIQQILEKFMKTLAGFCPHGRSDLSQPRCYCYNSDNTRNKNRTNSETCQALWAKDDKNLFAKAGSYAKTGSGKTPASGCMDVNKNFDPSCDCKRMVNSKGDNACLKVPIVSTIGGLDAMVKPPEVANLLNGVADGTFTPGNLDKTKLDQLSRAINKARNKLLPELNKQVAKDGKPLSIDSDFLDRAISSVSKKDRNLALANSSMPLISNARAANKGLEEALKKSEALGQINNANYDGGGKNVSSSSGGGTKKGLNFDFGGGGDSSNSNKIESFLDKKYDYKGSDIVQRDDLSIWSVISNRYNQSGLKKLFGDDMDFSE